MTTTRYYYSAFPAPYAVADQPGWDGYSNSNARARLSLTPGGGWYGTRTVWLPPYGPPKSQELARFVADSDLTPGTTTGRFTTGVQINGKSYTDGHLRVRVSLCDVTGTSRVVLADVATSPLARSAAVVWIVDEPLALATVEPGDRLLVEVGVIAARDNAWSSGQSVSTVTGDSTGIDQEFGVSNAGGNATWIDITWEPPPEPEPEPEPLGQSNRFWTHALAEALDLDPVDVQPVVELRRHTGTGWALDVELSHALTGYVVRYGRADATSDTPPTTATLDLSSTLAGPPLPIGTRLQVALCEPVATALGLDPADAVRFTGEVTDPTVDYDGGTTQLVCTGQLGRANRLTVDGSGWPVETDAARVARILDAVPLPLDVGTLDPGTEQLAAPDGPATVAALVSLVASSTPGQLVEQPTGALDWHGADHRRDRAPSLTLSAANVFRAVSWSQRLADVANTLTVTGAGGVAVTVTDPASADPVTGYGPYPATLDTALTTAADARTVGTVHVARRSTPAWQLPDLLVDLLRTLSTPQLVAALRLRHGSRLRLLGLPDVCPLPGEVFTEGWTETATPTTWRLTIPVSDPIQSGTSLRWVDVPATDAYQWADVDPTLTWFGAARVEHPTDLTTT